MQYVFGSEEYPEYVYGGFNDTWAIFVNGCYWHRHGCKATTTPKRNRAFWEAKFHRNVERDRERAEALREDGYRVVVVWECETKRDLDRLRERLSKELPPPR